MACFRDEWLLIRHFFNLKALIVFFYFSTKNICCGYSLEVPG